MEEDRRWLAAKLPEDAAHLGTALDLAVERSMGLVNLP
jgi:hypothetical protein